MSIMVFNHFGICDFVFFLVLGTPVNATYAPMFFKSTAKLHKIFQLCKLQFTLFGCFVIICTKNVNLYPFQGSYVVDSSGT